MQIPILPIRGQNKPWGSIPRINWGHPLTSKLLFYHYDIDGAGYDLAKGLASGFNSATTVGRKPTKFGTGLQYTGAVSAGIRYITNPTLRAAPPMAWASGFMRTTASTEGDNLFYCRGANNIASAPFCNWGIQDFTGSASNAIAVAVNSAGADVHSVTVTLGLNAYHAVVASAPTTATVNWWANGKPQTDMTALTIQSVTTNDNIVIGTDNGTVGGYQGQIYWAAFWNRTLSTAEALQLYLDPYCFLIYPEDEIFATLVGTAATFNSSAVGGYNYPWSTIGRKVYIIGAG